MNLVAISTSLCPLTMVSLPMKKSEGDLGMKPKQVSEGDL